MRISLSKPVVISCAMLVASVAVPAAVKLANLAPFANDNGVARTFNANGDIDLSNAFFADLGSNGRSCGSCHQPADAWTITPAHVQQRFAATQGLDPIFRTNDGADCPSADVSTVAARQQSYSMLLSKGLIRVSIGVPSNAQFAVTNIADPHNCADTTAAGLALFRRPLPACNLPFLTTVMWDGRESFAGNSLEANLKHQAIDATLGHAQAAHAPSDDHVAEIVKFEMAIFTAQSADTKAGNLNAQGADGGPQKLSQEKFYTGINDPLGANPSGAGFNQAAFTLFNNWSGLTSPSNETTAARAAIARGQALFNHKAFTISGVTGLNDLPGLSSLSGTCTTCHDTPNVGNHSVPLAINIGVADYPPSSALNTAGLPVYTMQCEAGVTRPIGQPSTFQTTDPGRALITGKCADIGKTKGPILRGLAARPPYFHNGSAATLRDVVNFYDQRFAIGLTQSEKNDLVAFLQSL